MNVRNGVTITNAEVRTAHVLCKRAVTNIKKEEFSLFVIIAYKKIIRCI